MIVTDEGALECDLMQTYNIGDYRALPARRAALYASGLGPESRIQQRLTGAMAPVTTILLAGALDALNTLVWMSTKDGARGRNRPASILDALRGEQSEIEALDSAEEFEAWRNSMLRG